MGEVEKNIDYWAKQKRYSPFQYKEISGKFLFLKQTLALFMKTVEFDWKWQKKLIVYISVGVDE